MKQDQLNELLLQSLEHEKGGVKVYETALRCVVNKDLREEWKKYLEQTRNHVKVLTEVCETLRLKPEQDTRRTASSAPCRFRAGTSDGNGAWCWTARCRATGSLRVRSAG